MTGRDDSEGYEPHPGDPWHPGWKDPSAAEDDADLFEVPEPEGDEDRARFFRRLLRKDGDAEDGETVEGALGDDDSSVEHVYDALRPDPLADSITEPVAEPVAEASEFELAAEEPVVDPAAMVTGEIETGEDTDEVAVAAAEISEDEPEVVFAAAELGQPEALEDEAAVDDGDMATGEIPSADAAAPAVAVEDEDVETVAVVSFEAESVPVAQVEWDLREYEAVPTAHLEAMRQLEDGLLEVELDLEDAELADELLSAADGLEAAQREASVAEAIERERVAEAVAIASADAQLDAESARITHQVRAAAVSGARDTESRAATREQERFEVDLREQQQVAAAALTAAGTADALQRGSHFEASLLDEHQAKEQNFGTAEAARSRHQLMAAQGGYHAGLARAGEETARFEDVGAEAGSLEQESARAASAIAAAADAHAESSVVSAARALETKLDEDLAAEERDALDRELMDASAPAFYLGTAEVSNEDAGGDEVVGHGDAEGEGSDGLPIEDLAPVFAVSVVAPRKRRWWQRLFGRDPAEAADQPDPSADMPSGDTASEIPGTGLPEETTAMEPAALAFAGMAADPPDRTDDAADETGELDQPVLVPAEADGGFEGWLDPEEEAKRAGSDDAYAKLADDDAEEEIAGWMAFTRNDDGEESEDAAADMTDEMAGLAPDERGDTESDEVASLESSEDAEEDADEFAAEDETPSIPAGGAAAVLTDHSDTDIDDESVIDSDWEVEDFVGDEPTDEHEFDEYESGDEAPVPVAEGVEETEETPADDTGELEAIAAALAPVTGDSELSDDDDTGELDVVDGSAGAEQEEDTAAGAVVAGAAAAAVFDFDEFTGEDYVQTATSDHAGLAEAMAEAGDEPTEQVALTADMPGLESGVVSFDDVVESEDVYAGAAVSPRSDLPLRVITAVVLIGAFAASLLWPPALIALAIAVFVLAAGEFYTALMQRGFQPIALFGFLAIVGASLGTVVWGVIAIPSSFLLAIAILLLFLAVVPKRRDPMLNLGLTITVAAWIGGLGSFAFDIIAADDYRTLVLAVVITVAVVDIAQYFVGRAIGRHQLAPVISPKKTVEGLVGGVVVAFLVGASLHFFPPFDLASGLAFGAIVAVFAPVGDLAVSSAKRSLDLKDMGSILPGHGGLLDRIDSLIFVIPAAWALFTWLGYL